MKKYCSAHRNNLLKTLVVLATVLLVHCCIPSMAQVQSCPPIASDMAYASGERLNYVVSYTWGVWYNVGEVAVNTIEVHHPHRPFYKISALGSTYKFYDVFFKVRDYFETRMDARTLQPFYFHRDIMEGGYDKVNYIDYNRADSVLYARSKRSKHADYRRDTLPATDCTFDVVSVVYYYRNLDMDKLQADSTYQVDIALDNEVYTMWYKWLGREEIKVKGLGTFKALKFTASLIAGKVFTGKEQIVFWATDDRNKLPIYVESPIAVGSIRARLKPDYTGLKYPLTSKVK